jgi:hypothetical protein
VGAGVNRRLGAAALVTRVLSRFFVLVGANDASTFAIVIALLAASRCPRGDGRRSSTPFLR